MLTREETELLNMIQQSMLPGQDGIKLRAFLAFNRGNALATRENLDNLQKKDAIEIKNDTLYPLETL